MRHRAPPEGRAGLVQAPPERARPLPAPPDGRAGQVLTHEDRGTTGARLKLQAQPGRRASGRGTQRQLHLTSAAYENATGLEVKESERILSVGSIAKEHTSRRPRRQLSSVFHGHGGIS